ncbi:MAG: CRTAC1 family protein, partial [Bryobacteraceae bacterium]
MRGSSGWTGLSAVGAGALALMAWNDSWRVHRLPFTLVNGETAKKPLPATTPGGIAVFDFDGDGRLDLFLPNGGALSPAKKASNRLLRNQGGMKFEDVTARAGLSGRDYDIGAAVGDYDNDGRPDLLVCGLHGVTLYRNQGNGTFQDVTKTARLDNRGRWSVGAVWFDMDKDADIDLFVVNYVRWQPAAEQECLVNGKPDFCHPRNYDAQPNALFRNNGDGTFTDVSEVSGIAAHLGKGMAAAAADFDGDGLPDLFVTNDRTFAFLFRNLGGGRFAERAFEWGVAVPGEGKPVSGMGVDAQDYDNDGLPDLIYTALRDETFPIYRNRGTEFVEATSHSRLAVLSRAMSGWGVAFSDLDNDGWKDIAVARSDALSATGGRGEAAKEPPGWFRNLGDGKFAAGAGWTSAAPAMYRGLVPADLDDDGCVDIVLTALNEEARVLRNPCEGVGNWLKIDIQRPATRVRAGTQWWHATTAVGYGSSYAGPLHFGLGTAMRIDLE